MLLLLYTEIQSFTSIHLTGTKGIHFLRFSNLNGEDKVSLWFESETFGLRSSRTHPANLQHDK